ncbi:NtaA/DmoA family FMN-dependent monooxygenase [Bartonella sp. LJL80]
MKQLHIGMSLTPTWFNGSGWRRDDSNVEAMFSLDFYTDIARRAEKAHLDFLFRADALFLPEQGVASGPSFMSFDATVLLAALIRETKHIGLLTTVSTTFVPPYVLARQIQSMHQLSRGRAGWNIVTALGGNENFSLDRMPASTDRYEHAAEVTDIVKKLWASFPEDALIGDRRSGQFADVDRIKPIQHKGKYHQIMGPLNLPASGTQIPLIQAGASDAGKDFAASVADAVFAATPDREMAIELRNDLRRRAVTHGRSPDDILLLPALNLYLADTRREAQDLFEETFRTSDNSRKLAYIKKTVGIDLTDWPADKPVTLADLPEAEGQVFSQTHTMLLKRLIDRHKPTVAELLMRPEVTSASHWQVIGTVEDAVDVIRDWHQHGAIDGFICTPGGSVNSLDIALDQLMPALVDANLLRRDYTASTFIGHLKN